MCSIALAVILVSYLTSIAHAILQPSQSNALWADMLSNSDPSTSSNDPLLNINLNASSLVDASNIAINCFDDTQDFLPTNMANYYEALQQILIRHDVLVSRRFYLGPTPEARWKWSGGAIGDERPCSIVLANKKPLLTDAFPIILVAHVAALVAQECITEAKGFLGGLASDPNKGVVLVGNVKSPG